MGTRLKTRYYKYPLITLFICLLSFQLFAAEWTDGEQVRMDKPWGITMGLGEPFPSLLGINLCFNIFKTFRANLAYGTAGSEEASLSTWGGGIKIFFPNWIIAPFLGLHYSNVSYQGTKPIHGITSSSIHLVSSLGIDVQLESGANIGLAYNFSLTRGISGLPSLYIGWFFDFKDFF